MGTSPLEPELALETPPFEPAVIPPRHLGTTAGHVEVPCAPAGRGAVAVTLATDGPPWAVITVSPRVAEAPECGPGGGATHAKFALFVTPTSDAPAFERGRVSVTAQANGFGEATRTVEAVPGFYAMLDALPDPPIRREPAGEAVTYATTVRNLGNGPVRVRADALDVTPDFTLRLPDAFELDSRFREANATRVLQLVMTSPNDLWFSSRIGKANVLFTTESVDDPTATGATITVSVLLAAVGRVAAVRASADALALIAIALAAAAGRARRPPSGSSPGPTSPQW